MAIDKIHEEIPDDLHLEEFFSETEKVDTEVDKG